MTDKFIVSSISNERTICSVCAWRAVCQKKYNFDYSTSAKCLDYARDLTLHDVGDLLLNDSNKS